MSIDSKHPSYSAFVKDWQLMTDAYSGERAIRDAGIEYLPATPGQYLDGMQANQTGYMNYLGYKARAVFPDFVKLAVEALIGVMHQKPPTIELPSQMEPLREQATVKGESLEMLLRRINEAQLVAGRVGLLADVVDGSPVGVLPYVALYGAMDIINWDDGAREEIVLQNLNLVVLNETESERGSGLDWVTQKKYRVLILGDAETNEPTDEGVYRVALYDEKTGTNFSEGEFIEPSIAGNTLNKIPFVIINSKDIVPDTAAPPLLGLANLALTVYRGEADYRQSLFMQGQDTMVIMGGNKDDDLRAGAGAAIYVQLGGDAKYIGVSSQGLPEMRMALENDRKEAAETSGRLVDTQGGEKESGQALRIRISAKTASLNQIALAGAEGLQTILRIEAEWLGINPEEVVVQANTDFADDTLEGRTLVEYMQAKVLGAPLSNESIHLKLQEKDLTSLTFEEELEAIAKEDLGGGDGTNAGGDSDDDE